MDIHRNSKNVVRGSSNDQVDQKPLKKPIDTFMHLFDNKTNFFSTVHPDIIEEAFLKYLESRDTEVTW